MTTGVATTENKTALPTKARNGLIDFYRFFFSLVVVKNHSLFIVSSPYFGPGRACVEFFFILSGFLFYSFLERCKTESIRESILRLHKTRFLPLAIPTCIGVLSNVIECFVERKFSVWGYLWYIEVMFIEMVVLILLRRWIKSDKRFMLVILGIMAVAVAVKFFTPLYSWGFIRGASTIPMGLFLASLPKLKRKWLATLLLIPTVAICFLYIFFNLANVEWLGFRIPELLLDNLVYPALVYLTFCIEIKSRLLSYLGALSFGLYAFQCTADLLRTLGVQSRLILFGVILLATLIEDSAKRVYKLRKRKSS